MPIIASQTINIDVKKDKSIDVRFLEVLNQNRCVNLSSFTSTTDEKEQLRNIVKKLVGEKVIECDDNVCCISENYHSFVDKLRGLRE